MGIRMQPWRIQDQLIEQPSWGGRYIIDLKGLSDDAAWAGKKVGQSYELAGESKVIDPERGAPTRLKDLIAASARDVLGEGVLARFGSDLSLLIKLTQAKGNSFQVHLPVGKKLGHWKPKPEAWFYLAPGIFTFGLRKGASYDRFSAALLGIDALMKDLSSQVKSGAISVERARSLAAEKIANLDPRQYVNVIRAETDDIVDLTDGGIHHSWEEDDVHFPQGNLVYEVQVDVPDPECSMRGFDKGKLLDDGGLRPTHVADYLATIERDESHNDLSQHIRKPAPISTSDGCKVEALFQTPYFLLDRLTVHGGGKCAQSASAAFHHLFVFDGSASIAQTSLEKGQSYFVPAAVGDYTIESAAGAVVFKTHLPV